MVSNEVTEIRQLCPRYRHTFQRQLKDHCNNGVINFNVSSTYQFHVTEKRDLHSVKTTDTQMHKKLIDENVQSVQKRPDKLFYLALNNMS